MQHLAFRFAMSRVAGTIAGAVAVALAILHLAASHAVAGPAARASGPADENRRDEAALRAIVDHWDRAELDGDPEYLAQLLAPEYRSVGAAGEATTRATLLEHAERVRRSAEARAERRKSGEAFLRAHPTEVAVAIHGALGIVSYYNPRRGVDHSVRGSDVFVYENGRWYAVYSLHNGAA